MPVENRSSRPDREGLAICCVNVSPLLRAALEARGHVVLHLAPAPGETPHLPTLLERAGFRPDAVLQQELLLPRVLLSGLGELSCPKAFWAIDPHLNAFWQSCYARLFDVVFSTQRRWMPDLARHGAGNVLRLPWFAEPAEWRPWSGRDAALSFVGRVGSGRPVRRSFVELLCRHFGPAFVHAADLDARGMAELYARTRLVPNESILGEINFRTFEAVRHGCLAVGPALGPEQDELFVPGREVLCYADGLELLDVLEHALRHPHAAATVARAGWERLRAEHRPAHRAEALVRALREAPRCAATGRDADAWLAATACQLRRAGRLGMDVEPSLDLLRRQAHEPALLALRLRLLAEEGRTGELRADLAALLAGGGHAGNLEVDAAASLAARKAGFADAARAFRLRRERTLGSDRKPHGNDPGLLRYWAGELRKGGCVANTGFVFREDRHVPASAGDCLALGLLERPGDLDLVRQYEALLASQPGQETARLGLLSTLTLHRREDWRLGLEAGLVNLRAFRIEAGREELLLACKLAREQHAEERLLAVLDGRDPSGRARRLMDAPFRPMAPSGPTAE